MDRMKNPPLLAALLLLCCATAARAQQPPIHYPHSADSPPGRIGQLQLMRGGPLPGYFQPVELRAPQGAAISLPGEGYFEPPQAGPVMAGLLIGQVYRVKITNIPRHEGVEVFPSIELVNRLYPPEGKSLRFPIPIELTEEELDYAVNGKFVTRVIYLEDPNAALPMVQQDFQRVFDVADHQDPLRVADGFGRPMAILRIGSRIPPLDATTGRFLFGSPPLVKFELPEPIEHEARRNDAPAIERHESVPRIPIRR